MSASNIPSVRLGTRLLNSAFLLGKRVMNWVEALICWGTSHTGADAVVVRYFLAQRPAYLQYITYFKAFLRRSAGGTSFELNQKTQETCPVCGTIRLIALSLYCRTTYTDAPTRPECCFKRSERLLSCCGDDVDSRPQQKTRE